MQRRAGAADAARALRQRLRQPGQPSLAADGSAVVFARPAEGDPERSTLTIWEGGALRALAVDAADYRVPRFAPTGRGLVVAVGDDELRAIDRDSCRTTWTRTAPGYVEELAFGADGELVAIVAESGADRGVLAGGRRLDTSDDPQVVHAGQGRRRIYSPVDETWHPTDAGLHGLTVWDVDVLPPAAVVAVCSPDPTESGWYGAGLWHADPGGARLLYQPEWQLGRPVLDPQGGRVAVVEGWASDRGFVAGDVQVIALANRHRAVLTIPEIDVAAVSWRDDSSLWFSGWQRTTAVAGWVGLDGSLATVFPAHGRLSEVSLRRGRDPGWHVSAIRAPLGAPPEVAVGDPGGLGWHSISPADPQLIERYADVAAETIAWPAADGTVIEGLVLGLRPGAAAPLVVHIHGGPANLWANFGPLDLLLAEAGYTVLLPNPRGSVGRGAQFSRANLGDAAGAELGDVISGVDELVRRAAVDPGRVGVTGGSYGGYLTACAVTMSDRFAAGVMTSGHPDLLSARHGSNNPAFYDRLLGHPPYGEGAAHAYLRRSPIIWVSPRTAPTLVLHGAADRCTPVGQAQEFYRAVLDAGVETELVVYPREGHSLREHPHQVDAWTRTLDWFDRHLQGVGTAGAPGASPAPTGQR